MKKILKELYPYVIIIVVVVLFRTFIATPVKVDGDSMDSTLKDNDILILNKLNKKYDRFDVVVINVNLDGHNTKIIKRIIGLPGDNVYYKDNVLYINNKKVEDKAIARTGNFSLKELYNIDKIPEGYYFVMGDNRPYSRDSRDTTVGLIKESNIQGKTSFRIFRFSKFGKFE